MKKSFLIVVITSSTAFLACKKTEQVTNTTLTASATQVGVGQAVTFNVSTSQNVVSWSVTPLINCNKAVCHKHAKNKYNKLYAGRDLPGRC